MKKSKVDLPLEQAVALVRACQKLNCDTADELFAMVERRCKEAAAVVGLRTELKKLGIVKRERMAESGRFIHVGYLCRVCDSEWDCGQAPSHRASCSTIQH